MHDVYNVYEERTDQVILPTYEIFTELLVSVASVMSPNLITEIVSDACACLQYDTTPEIILKYSEQLMHRNLTRIREESGNLAYATDCASRIARAWYNFTIQLHQIYRICNLYVDGVAVCHFVAEVDGDLVLHYIVE